MNKPVLDVPFGKRDLRLDVVRGIAVLMVVVFHTSRIYPGPGIVNYAWAAMTNSLWSGVDLFFVLSGFLITGILIDSRGHTQYFKNFYVRRSLRIFPLFYGVLIGLFVVLPLLAPQIRSIEYWQTLNDRQLWLWTYLHNFLQARGPHQLPGLGHFWTLAVEEQFYWLWPLVVFFVAPRRLLWLSLAICISAPILRTAMLMNGVTAWAIRELTFTRIDSLVWGALAAIIIRDSGLAKVIAKQLQWILVACAAFFIGVLTINGELPYEGSIMVTLGYSVLACTYACIVYRIAADQRSVPVQETPVVRFFAWLGTVSYGLYVFHVPISLGVLAALKKYTQLSGIPHGIVAFVVTFVISCVAAQISWKLWESPWLRLKKYFSYSRRKQDTIPGVAPAES